MALGPLRSFSLAYFLSLLSFLIFFLILSFPSQVATVPYIMLYDSRCMGDLTHNISLTVAVDFSLDINISLCAVKPFFP